MTVYPASATGRADVLDRFSGSGGVDDEINLGGLALGRHARFTSLCGAAPDSPISMSGSSAGPARTGGRSSNCSVAAREREDWAQIRSSSECRGPPWRLCPSRITSPAPAVAELTGPEEDGGMGMSNRRAAEVLGVDHQRSTTISTLPKIRHAALVPNLKMPNFRHPGPT